MSNSDHHTAPMSPVEQRVAALEALLTERGLVPEGFIEEITRRYETEIGPMNGAKVVARAWADPEYKLRLLADGTAAIAELGFGGPEGDHLVVVENTAAVHNVIVCTLCSCYPWPVLGLPPAWYKDPPYRARMVREPRALLAEMGCPLPEKVEIRVWDSSAEVRYLVLPEGWTCPAATASWPSTHPGKAPCSRSRRRSSRTASAATRNRSGSSSSGPSPPNLADPIGRAGPPRSKNSCPEGGYVAGVAGLGRWPQTPMWTNPHARKSSSAGRSMSAVASARLRAPACAFERASAAWLSW